MFLFFCLKLHPGYGCPSNPLVCLSFHIFNYILPRIFLNSVCGSPSKCIWTWNRWSVMVLHHLYPYHQQKAVKLLCPPKASYWGYLLCRFKYLPRMRPLISGFPHIRAFRILVQPVPCYTTFLNGFNTSIEVFVFDYCLIMCMIYQRKNSKIE